MSFKNFTFITLTMLLLSLSSINSWAESNSKYDAAYQNCVTKAGIMNNAFVYKCSELVSDMVKKEMNKLYKIIYKNISERSKDDVNKFEQSQKAWLKYRKSHCELMGSYVGSPMYSFCPMGLNKLRVIELTELSEQ